MSSQFGDRSHRERQIYTAVVAISTVLPAEVATPVPYAKGIEGSNEDDTDEVLRTGSGSTVGTVVELDNAEFVAGAVEGVGKELLISPVITQISMMGVG